MTLTQIKPAGLSKPVDLADNEKIRLGTGNDLQIYHDDGKSYIKNTTLGSIFINSVSHTYIANSDNSEYYAKFHGNGSAQLFFDNS